MAKLTKKCKQITNRCTCYLIICLDFVIFQGLDHGRALLRSHLLRTVAFATAMLSLSGLGSTRTSMTSSKRKVDHSTSYSHDVHHISPLTGLLPQIQFQPCPTSKHRQSQRAASCKRAARPALLPAQEPNKSGSDQTLRKSLWLQVNCHQETHGTLKSCCWEELMPAGQLSDLVVCAQTRCPCQRNSFSVKYPHLEREALERMQPSKKSGS